jgi:hypothetical protein
LNVRGRQLLLHKGVEISQTWESTIWNYRQRMSFTSSHPECVVSQSIGAIPKGNRMKASNTITAEHKSKSTTQALANEVLTPHSEAPRKHDRRRIHIPLIQKEQQFHVDSGGHAVVLSGEISDNCLRMLVHTIHDLIESDGDEEAEDRAVAILHKLIEVALHG